MTSQKTNDDVIVRLFGAFSQRDPKAMLECYHPDAHFEDPVFGKLSQAEINTMWTMLCERGKDLRIELLAHQADETSGSAEWAATYTFSATGRLVRNVVQSQFRFADGLIVEQKDSFDLWKWTRMALGAPGRILGWTPLVQGKVRRNARASLDAFRTEQA